MAPWWPLGLLFVLPSPSFDQAGIQTEQIQHASHRVIHDVGHARWMSVERRDGGKMTAPFSVAANMLRM